MARSLMKLGLGWLDQIRGNLEIRQKTWFYSARRKFGACGNEFAHRAAPFMRLGLMLALIALPAVALAAIGETGNSDEGFDSNSAMSTSTRLMVYGIGFCALCLVSFKVPDAPLLLLVFTMPIVEFQGLRLGLTLFQCFIVCLRTQTVRHLVPSWPLSVFLISITASASWALDPRVSLVGESIGIIAMLLQLPIAVAARALIGAGLSNARRLLWALTLGCIPGFVLVTYHALAGITWHEGSKAYYIGFLRPDIFSPMLVISGVFLLFCVTSDTVRGRGKLVAGSLLPAICVALLLSGIRSGWTAFLLTTVVVLVLSRSWAGLAGLGAAAAVLILLWLTMGSSMGIEDQLHARLSQQSLETGEMRVRYWEVAAQGFCRSPLVGLGWGSFPYLLADSIGMFMLTHNIFMRIACELGLLGLGLFLTWVVTTLLGVRYTPNGLLVQMLILAVLVQGLFLDHFPGNYFWLFVGLCDGAARLRQSELQDLTRITHSCQSPANCGSTVAA